MCDFQETYVKLKKYLVGSGRATRTEFWVVNLSALLITSFASCIAFLVLLPFGEAFDSAPKDQSHADWLVIAVCLLGIALVLLEGAIMLLQIWILLATCVRRLHDCDFPGWPVLALFIPVVGPILFLGIGLMWPHEPNRYGENPRLLRASATAQA